VLYLTVKAEPLILADCAGAPKASGPTDTAVTTSTVSERSEGVRFLHPRLSSCGLCAAYVIR
jgi:hypothetical protein